MVKYIIDFFLRFLIKCLKNFNKNINYIIKFLNIIRNKRFSTIKKRIRYIKGIVNYLKSTKIYKIYKIYNISIKFIALVNLLLVLSFTKFQIKLEVDYIALFAFIYSILSKITTKLESLSIILKIKEKVMSTKSSLREIINKIYTKFFNNTNSLSKEDSAGRLGTEGGTTPVSEGPKEAPLAGGCPMEGNGEADIKPSISDNKTAVSIKDQEISLDNSKGAGHNKTYIIALILISIGSYLYWDIYTQNIIYSGTTLLYDKLISFFLDTDDDSLSSSSVSSASSSSLDSNRTITQSDFNTHLRSEPALSGGGGSSTASITNVRTDETVPIFPPISIPDGSRILNTDPDQLIIVTPDNRLIITDRSSSPLGSFTSTRFELDRNNNFSRTEILTNYPENRFDLPPLPAQQIPSEASNIPAPLVPEEIYNRFRFNIEHVSDNTLADIFDIFS